MSAERNYDLTCDSCRNQFYDETEGYFPTAESARIIRQHAKECGWTRKRVENGSLWDFCPKCQKEE